MEERLEEIIAKIKQLENEWYEEIRKKEDEFYYRIKKKRIEFGQEIRKQHIGLKKLIRYYLRDAALLNILTIPVIYSCLAPALLMDLVMSFYQWVCFPIYGIPRVRRSDYIVIDRQYLNYLNAIEKINCMYCGYFNGVVAYAREVGARTEQYWCPIKHARKLRAMHSRYKNFFHYGDAKEYRNKLEKVRRSFDDVKQNSEDNNLGGKL